MPQVSPSPILEMLHLAARRRPDGWAVRDPEVEVSYESLLRRALREAEGIAYAGVGRGSLLMVDAIHRVDYLVSYFAGLAAGARVMPVDAAASQAEVAREVERYGVEFKLRPGVEPLGDRLTAVGPRRSRVPPAESAVLLPTSGTSGLPKRAIHREARLIANARAHAASVDLSSDDVCLVSLSPAFGYCHTAQILASLVQAGRLVFPPRPALPQELGRVCAAYGVTTTTMVPYQLTEAMLDGLAWGRLRHLVVGGSPVAPDLIDRVGAAMPGVEFVQTWGMTEAGPRITTWRASRDRHRPGSVGKPLTGVRVVAAGPDGRVPLATLSGDYRITPRELVVCSPCLMAGYLDAPGETADVLLAEDVLRTGDVGRVDGDGHVYVDGRVKTLIDVSGKKVSPEEIEWVLLQIPGIAEARVVGEPDPRRGEHPVAYVVPTGQAQIEPVEIGRILHGQLARYKWPKRIEVVDHLARTLNGKVRRW